MINDVVFSIIVVLIFLVLLGIPDIFWKFFTVVIIFAGAIFTVWALHALTIAEPLVVLAFLSGSVITIIVLASTKRTA
jgi:hypothetical protein